MTYRNRALVLGANGVINLSVPLVGGRDKVRLTRDIAIDYSRRWQTEQWRTLQSCYNNSPFFFHYAGSLENVIRQPVEYLWELNFSTMSWALQQLKWLGELFVIHKPEDLESYEMTEVKMDLPSQRKRKLLDPYIQTFGLPFEPNLSILDLLFNMGPNARKYLENCTATDSID